MIDNGLVDWKTPVCRSNPFRGLVTRFFGTSRANSRHWGHGCIFLGHIFWKKAFCLLASPKQMSSLTISNENSFSKTQGTRLGAIVALNKCLE